MSSEMLIKPEKVFLCIARLIDFLNPECTVCNTCRDWYIRLNFKASYLLRLGGGGVGEWGGVGDTTPDSNTLTLTGCATCSIIGGGGRDGEKDEEQSYVSFSFLSMLYLPLEVQVS